MEENSLKNSFSNISTLATAGVDIVFLLFTAIENSELSAIQIKEASSQVYNNLLNG